MPGGLVLNYYGRLVVCTFVLWKVVVCRVPPQVTGKFAVFIDIRKLFRHPVMLSDEHALGAVL